MIWLPPEPPAAFTPLWATYCPDRTTKQRFAVHNSLGQARSAIKIQELLNFRTRKFDETWRELDVGVWKSGWRKGQRKLEREHRLRAAALYVRANGAWELVHVIQDGDWPSDCPVFILTEGALKNVRYRILDWQANEFPIVPL